jgi:hypothetical protein
VIIERFESRPEVNETEPECEQKVYPSPSIQKHSINGVMSFVNGDHGENSLAQRKPTEEVAKSGSFVSR